MSSFSTESEEKVEKKKRGRKKKAEQPPAPEEVPLTEEEEKELEEQSQALMEALLSSAEQVPEKPRIVGLFGNVDEEMAGEIISSMILLKSSGKTKDPLCEEGKATYKPFELWISTLGGVAMDMFAVYDTMRSVREECEIHTVALGKVMSAGVLLLAAGTKGKRRIGKNCRIMLHSVIGGHSGALHNLENEMEEVRWIQQQHINCLTEETHMSEKHLKKLLSRKVNVYLTAEEAVELGIADEIF